MKNEKLYRVVIDGVLEQIRAGRPAVGGKLPTERELAEMYGVSRTTVREAMVALEMLGTVEMRQGSGVYVLRLPDNNGATDELDIGAFELMEARRALEGEVAALAAAYIDAEQLTMLEGLVRDMEDPDERKAEAADREFHVIIAKASGNGALLATIAFLWDMRERAPLARTILHRARVCGMEARIAEHRAVLAALREHDPVQARIAMRAHLDRVIEHLLVMTESDEIEAARKRTVARRHRLAPANEDNSSQH